MRSQSPGALPARRPRPARSVPSTPTALRIGIRRDHRLAAVRAAVLVPVKSFRHAKVRLASALDADERVVARSPHGRRRRHRGATAPGFRRVRRRRGRRVGDEQPAPRSIWRPGRGLNGAVADGVTALAALELRSRRRRARRPPARRRPRVAGASRRRDARARPPRRRHERGVRADQRRASSSATGPGRSGGTAPRRVGSACRCGWSASRARLGRRPSVRPRPSGRRPRLAMSDEPGQPSRDVGRGRGLDLPDPLGRARRSAHIPTTSSSAPAARSRSGRLRGCTIHHVVCTDGSKGTWDVDCRHRGARRPSTRRATRRGQGARLDRRGRVPRMARRRARVGSRATVRGRAMDSLLRPDVVLGHDPWRRYRLHPDHRHAGPARVRGDRRRP